MYKVTKNNYILRFTKEKKGLILKVSYISKKATESKYFSIIPPGNVYMHIKEKWELLDTSTLKHEREAQNYIERSSYDLIRVILLFPIKEPLVLTYDEIFFLQALSYDLFTENKSWLPLGNEYKFVKDHLVTIYDKTTYVYEMPTSLGISLEQFLNKENNYIKKQKQKRFLEKIPLKVSKNKKITHKPDSPIKVPLVEYTPSANKTYESLPVIKEINCMDVTTEEISEKEEKEEEELIVKTESEEEAFKTDDITLTEDEITSSEDE